MATNAELSHRLKRLEEAVKSMLKDLANYSTISMSDAKEYLDKLK